MKIEKIFPIEDLKAKYQNYGTPTLYAANNFQPPEFALLIQTDDGRKFILQRPHIDTSHLKNGVKILGNHKKETEMISYKQDKFGNNIVSGYNLIFTYDGINLTRMLQDTNYANYVINTLLTVRHLNPNTNNQYYVETNDGLQEHMPTGIFNLGAYNPYDRRMHIYSPKQTIAENEFLKRCFQRAVEKIQMEKQQQQAREQAIKKEVAKFWELFGDDPQVLKEIHRQLALKEYEASAFLYQPND